MSKSNTKNGKAFEFACLCAIVTHFISDGKTVGVESSKQLNTAQKAFESFGAAEQDQYMKAAETAVKLLLPLEPKLENGRGLLSLRIAADRDAQGQEGDVRDVLCVRGEDDDWTIGMSCKHNHEALRHPRITEGKDFGKDWIGIPCSRTFIDAITPITESLIAYGANGTEWCNIAKKSERYYIPILEAYRDEIVRMCATYNDIPKKLLSYFFGAADFYKVIMKSSARTTTIEGFNMHGTLNAPCGKIKARTRVPVITMPTRLIDASFKKRSKTTIILTFDEGWTLSMRIHNKDKIAKPTSLAWDVQLVGFPSNTFVNTHSWDE